MSRHKAGVQVLEGESPPVLEVDGEEPAGAGLLQGKNIHDSEDETDFESSFCVAFLSF